MYIDLLVFRFEIDTTMLAGISLWALALYLAFFPLSEQLAVQISRWFNFAERSLYTSEDEFERTRKARESQNDFYASIFSVIPFFFLGALCNFGVDVSLGQSWSISLGIVSCIGCGIYELGRRSTISSEE